MKAGYALAAWRLFQPSLRLAVARREGLTWADAELAETPFGATRPSLPIVAVRGIH